MENKYEIYNIKLKIENINKENSELLENNKNLIHNFFSLALVWFIKLECVVLPLEPAITVMSWEEVMLMLKLNMELWKLEKYFGFS